MQLHLLTVLHLIQLTTNVPDQTVEDAPNNWAPAPTWEFQKQPWLLPRFSSAAAFKAIEGVNLRKDDLFLTLLVK